MPFRLIIFDMDDTLISSADTWRPAETRLYHALHQPFREDIAARYKGMNARDVGRVIHEHLQPCELSAEECGQRLRAYLLESFHGPLTLMPGADALVRALAGRYTLAVASGSPPEAIRLVLDRCGWSAFFSLVVTSEDMPRGKPAPDVFLETARLAGCPPHEALVIEDSLPGVQAAAAAGMTCFVVPSSADPCIQAAADRCFPSLHGIMSCFHAPSAD